MAQVNITLNLEELIALLVENREEAFKHIVEKILNEALLAESVRAAEGTRRARP